MSAHQLNLAINTLFFLAGGISSFDRSALYRLAVITTLLALHFVWTRRWTKRRTLQEIIDLAESGI